MAIHLDQKINQARYKIKGDGMAAEGWKTDGNEAKSLAGVGLRYRIISCGAKKKKDFKDY